MPVLTPEQLTQLRIATERLLELPEAAQWDARGYERRTDEAKVKRAIFGLLNAVNKAVGVRALADLVRQTEASADSDGKLSSYAESVVYAALMRQIPASVLEEHVPRIVEALGQAALRSENAERELLGLEPIESLAKQFEYAGTALLFQDRYPALSGSVEAYMTDAVGNHAQAVTGKIVDAANPANPMGIGPLQQQLRGEVSDLTVKRSTTIARTETARVYGETARGTFKANGITRARLVTAGDPCPECEAVAAQGFVPVDDLEEVPIHPNCRCDYIPDVEGWLPPGEKVVDPVPQGPAEWSRFKTPSFDKLADQTGWIRGNWYHRTGDVRPASKLLMKDPTAYNKALGSHKTAARLLNKVADSPRQTKLYRGIRVNADEIPKVWKVGSEIDVPLSSFTTNPEMAAYFGRAGADQVAVTFEFHNARGLVLDKLTAGLPLDSAGMEEVIAAGRAKITSVVRETQKLKRGSQEHITIVMAAT